MSDHEPRSVQGPVTGQSIKRKPALRRLFRNWLLSILVLFLGAIAGITLTWLQYTSAGPLTQSKIVQLPVTASRSQIATALQEQGVISNALVFSVIAAVSEWRHVRLKPGEYQFPASASMEDVLSMMRRGAFLTYKITIPEGWTSQMVVNRLNEQEQLEGTITQVPPEGSLLPETYIVTRGYPREKLLADMAAAQAKVLDQEWAGHDASNSPIKTRQDLVTLASIVEKETGVADERPMVAGVFINRLNQKMRLQSDPTIIYGLVGGKGKLDHALSRAELDQPNPYNTYQIDGLPPGPIANPGKAAIDAVMNPANTNMLYFVADGKGGHVFAATLPEHNANVKKWRATRDGDATAPQAAPATVPETTQQIPDPIPEPKKP